MVVVYTGRITHESYAIDRLITVVVPDHIHNGHSCLIYWQWSVTAAGEKNKNVTFNGSFSNLDSNEVECREPAANDPYYWFTWNISSNVMQLMNKRNEKCGVPTQLTQVYPAK